MESTHYLDVSMLIRKSDSPAERRRAFQAFSRMLSGVKDEEVSVLLDKGFIKQKTNGNEEVTSGGPGNTGIG
jgi:hypothetical protein